MREPTASNAGEDLARQHEEQLRLIADALPVLITYVDADQRYRFNNAAYESWFGVKREELRGKHLREVMGAEAYEAVRPHVEAVLSGERLSVDLELAYATGPRDVAVTYVPDRAADGRVRGYVALIEDISARKRGEGRVAEHARTVETINRVGRSIAAELDLQKLVQAVTDAACEVTGAQFGAFFYNVLDDRGESYTLYTISGVPRSHFERFPMPRNTAVFGPTFRGEGTVRSDDITQDRRYGKNAPHRGMPAGHLPVRSYLAAPVVLRAGEVLGGLFFGHGEPGRFTKQHELVLEGIAAQAAVALDSARLVEQLRTSEARLQLAVDIAQVGTFEIDLESDAVTVNDPGREIYGWPRDAELKFSDVKNHFHPDDRDEVMARIEAALDPSGRRQFEVEQRIVRTDGAHRWIRVRGRTLVAAGGGTPRTERLIGTYLDITAAKEAAHALEERVAERTRELLEHQRRLRRLALELTRTEQRERRRLAATLHDHLQQLLVAARMRMDAITLKAQAPALNASLSAVGELIGQSLEVSRSLTVQLSPPVLYDGGLIAALGWLSRWMKDKHDLTVYINADPQAEPEAEELRVMLFEATRELLFNVVKHARVGQASVRLAPVAADRLSIAVSDAGAGFDASALERRGADRGVGLVHVRERLTYLGGAMTLRSGTGRGTTVEMVAPRTLPTAAAEPALPAEDASRRRRDEVVANSDYRSASNSIRVLVVDDHRIVREGLVSLLADEPDIEVVGEAADGDVAVRLAAELRPDVIVMDITMPTMSGIEATRLITRERPEARVIGLTMHAESDMAKSLRDAGATAFLTKGGPSEALVAAIRGAAETVGCYTSPE